MSGKLGFCCKLVEPSGTGYSNVPSANYRSTTAKWLRSQGSRTLAAEKLQELVAHNLAATLALVSAVAQLPPRRRLVRLGSDLLPLYTHTDAIWFYQDATVRAFIKSKLAEVGTAARASGVRLSFHPGQFTVICSESESIVRNSIDELEYHASMAEWMGYGQTPHDFKINIHLSGRAGVAGFARAWAQMSPTLQSCLTIENDEFVAGLDTVLEVAGTVPIVLDLHHHFIKTGEYIATTDPRIQQVRDSWGDQQPVIHYSQSKWEYLQHFAGLPTLDDLLALAAKSKLRAHSEFYHHTATNDWAMTHLEWADMMAECKAKNLACDQLAVTYLV